MQISAFFNRVFHDRVLVKSGLWWYSLALCVFIVSALLNVALERWHDSNRLSKSDIQDIKSFAATLAAHNDPISEFLWNAFSSELREKLAASKQLADDTPGLKHSLARELNNVIRGNCIYETNRFAKVQLSLETQMLYKRNREEDGELSTELNRALLSDVYPTQVLRRTRIVNSFSTTSKWSLSLLVGGGAILGVITWSLFWRRGKGRQQHKMFDRALSFFEDPQMRHIFAAALAISCLIAVGTLIPLLLFTDKPGLLEWGRMALTNPGGVFTLVTGIMGLVGTYLAVHSILEIKHTITSFPQLMDRVAHLIEEEPKDTDLGVLFFAFTLLPGSWNANSRSSKLLEKALCSPKNKITAACLKLEDGYDHDKFLSLFKDKVMPHGKVSDSDIADYRRRCKSVAKVLKGESYDEWTKMMKSQACKVDPRELRWEDMPDYYFFVSSERAIIVVPVGMPTIRHPVIGDEVAVQTLGFETTDKRVVDMLIKEFERYAGPV